MEGLVVIAILIVLVVRTIKKHKASIKASQEKYRPQDYGTPAEPKTAPQTQLVQQRIDLDRAPMAPRVEVTHRHVEQVHTQAGGYAGEGDANRYNTREVSCETVGHEISSAAQVTLPKMNRENLVSAVIMSEVLGKPKALQR